MISVALLRQTWRDQRTRVAIVAIALGIWSSLLPVIYATFGRQLEAIIEAGVIPDAFLRLLGADPFSLNGAVALGATHPIAIALSMVYPVGFATAVIAGERQRGTLEVLLSRPLSRRTVFATLLIAIVGIRDAHDGGPGHRDDGDGDGLRGRRRPRRGRPRLPRRSTRCCS